MYKIRNSKTIFKMMFDKAKGRKMCNKYIPDFDVVISRYQKIHQPK